VLWDGSKVGLLGSSGNGARASSGGSGVACAALCWTVVDGGGVSAALWSGGQSRLGTSRHAYRSD
jgi:hypothetical protein